MVTKTINACLFIKTLEIGRQLENNYRQIIFDCSGFGEDIAEITLVHQRKQDAAPYIVTTSDGETLTWNISDTDTAYAGLGRAELRISFANGLAKSIVYATHVIESITGDTEIPEPLQSWYDAMIEYIDDHAATPEQIEAAVEAYLEDHPIPAPVQSVNSKTGAVILTAADVGALPDSTVIPTKTSDLTNDSGYITSVPVSSVNNKTGAVVLNASDVHALPDSTVIPTVPTNVSAFQNDAGYLTAIPSEYVTNSELQTAIAGKANTADLATVATSGDYADLTGKPTIPTVPTNVSAFANDANYITASGAPVQSVNGQTGAVTVTVPTKTSDLTNDSGFITSAPVASVDGKTGAVTVIPTGGSAGQVLAKASATDRDVEWITPSGGGGGGSEWTLVNKVTLSEPANVITIDTDTNGNSFALKNVLVTYFKETANAEGTNSAGKIKLVGRWQTYAYSFTKLNGGTFNDRLNEVTLKREYFSSKGNSIITCGAYGVGGSGSNYASSFIGAEHGVYPAIKIELTNDNSEVTFPVNTVVEVYTK